MASSTGDDPRSLDPCVGIVQLELLHPVFVNQRSEHDAGLHLVDHLSAKQMPGRERIAIVGSICSRDPGKAKDAIGKHPYAVRTQVLVLR
ncbi:hypothetical protein [Burkholderia stagnalis]|uniref:hypothetical protein n=1 Tax=Burkholderia stagnalis TaxID=1503054 RepID=UPI0007540847|nr:hypothetical protein [Burkholderia stagnalis]KVM81998.1 hypothetical protein WT05_21625 [Burkholderia stagnalis]